MFLQLLPWDGPSSWFLVKQHARQEKEEFPSSCLSGDVTHLASLAHLLQCNSQSRPPRPLEELREDCLQIHAIEALQPTDDNQTTWCDADWLWERWFGLLFFNFENLLPKPLSAHHCPNSRCPTHSPWPHSLPLWATTRVPAATAATADRQPWETLLADVHVLAGTLEKRAPSPRRVRCEVLLDCNDDQSARSTMNSELILSTQLHIFTDQVLLLVEF